MLQRIPFLFDFETKSRLNLKAVGGMKYALHPSTEPLLLAYTFGAHNVVKVWDCQNEPMPSEIAHVITNPELYDFVAWNVFFDICIWKFAMPRLFPTFNFKPIPLNNIHDAAALSMHFRTGAALDTSAVMHRLPSGKDKLGKAIMQKACKPGKNGEFIKLTSDEVLHFKRYAAVDVMLMKEIYFSLPPLPEAERYAWEWTFRRNFKGIPLDMKFVTLLQQLVEYVAPGLEAEFFSITGYKLRSPKLIAFFKQYYPHIESLDAENMEELYEDDRPVPPQIRRAIEIKYLIGSSSITKLKVALERNVGGRIYEILAYHQAATKRWAGKGLQVQNFPRVDKDPADPIDFDLNVSPDEICKAVLDYAHTRGLKEPIKFVRNLLRRIFMPEEGKLLCAGDFSKIEPTVLFWLVGLGALPPKWYEELAVDIFGMPLDQIGDESMERQIGKMGQLSCGYGAGWATFKKQVKKQSGLPISEELAKLTVNTYRRKYPAVVNAWTDLENAFRNAINGQPTWLFNQKVYIYPSEYRRQKMVIIRLPDGGCLYYHNPRILEEKKELKSSTPQNPKFKITYHILYDADGGEGKVETKKIYGGLLCENVVSAIARQIMRASMYRLECKGFDIMNLVHDEMWGCIFKEQRDDFINLMCERPAWALDMEIKAGDKLGERYLK